MDAIHQRYRIGSFAGPLAHRATTTHLYAGEKSISSLPRTIDSHTVYRVLQFIVTVTVLAFGISTYPAQAVETDIVEQVKDIFPGMIDGNPSSMANINGTLYFRAHDGVHGEELWRTDGTAAGTVMVKDINPGPAKSAPNDLTNVKGTLFFRAAGVSGNRELWRSDGTPEGTVVVKEIAPGNIGSNPENLINVNGNIYFTADATGTSTDVELWRSDGTSNGTVIVKDINPTGSSFPQFLTKVNDVLFFSADNGVDGFELWRSGGTANETAMVKDINPSGGSLPSDLTAVGDRFVDDKLYFAAEQAGTSPTGRELWVSDGTEGGTVLVKDIAPGAGNAFPGELINFDGSLLFAATDILGSGRELWRSDGTESGTILLRDINPAGNSDPHSLTLVSINHSPVSSNLLFFSANDGSTGDELWKSDGTTTGTVRVKDINPSGDSSPDILTNVNGTLYFNADNGSNGEELWKSDGTPGATMLLKDIRAGPNGSFSAEHTNVNGVLYFRANDGSTGSELWRAYVRTDTPPVFDDVPVSHPFYNAVTNLAISGYTDGCFLRPPMYCPSDPVTRAEMAVFLVRGIAGQDFRPKGTPGTVFDDISPHYAESWIETFKELELTGGCSASPPLYCPNDPVTRAQMAVFLLKAIHGSAYNSPPGTGTVFADVNIGDFAINWIEQLAKEGFTGGCGNGNFCPNDPVTRGQMAAFLTRVFHTPQLFE